MEKKKMDDGFLLYYMKKSKKRVDFFEKNFDKFLIAAAVLVFLFSFSYKFGKYFYTGIPWFFLFTMVFSFGTVLGILFFPLSLIYQTLFSSQLNFLPASLTTLYSLVILSILVILLSMGHEKVNKDGNLLLVIGLLFLNFFAVILHGLPISFQNFDFIHYLEAGVLFFALSSFIKSEKRLKLFSWILALGIAALAFRLYNHSFNYDTAIRGFENNDLARTFSFYVPFLVGLFWAEKKYYLKALALIILAFIVQGISQLGSRATYISIGVTAVLFGLFNIRKKTTWLFGAFGVIFILFFTSSFFFTDITSIIEHGTEGQESSEGSIAGRWWGLQEGWKVMMKKPITGYGVYNDRFSSIMDELYGRYKAAHNSYIIIGVEIGLLGLLLYASLFISSIIYCFRSYINTAKTNKYVASIANGTMFGLIAIGINQFMLNQPWIPTVFIGFGLASALNRLSETKKKGKYELPKYFRIIMILAMFSATVLGVLYILLKIFL